MMKKKVKRALNFLQTGYSNGIIDYPRMENSLITKESFDLFPHPQLNEFGKKIKPLSYNKYIVDKENSLLFLSIMRALTPSSIESVFNMIDEVFEDNMKIRADKEQYVNSIAREKEEFFKNKDITNSGVSEMRRSIYQEVRKQDIALIKIDGLFICSGSTPLLASLQKREHKQRTAKKETTDAISVTKEEDGVVYRFEVDSISEALKEWTALSEKIVDFQEENLEENPSEFLGIK